MRATPDQVNEVISRYDSDPYIVGILRRERERASRLAWWSFLMGMAFAALAAWVLAQQ